MNQRLQNDYGEPLWEIERGHDFVDESELVGESMRCVSMSWHFSTCAHHFRTPENSPCGQSPPRIPESCEAPPLRINMHEPGHWQYGHKARVGYSWIVQL
jgi:hypothetical protein